MPLRVAASTLRILDVRVGCGLRFPIGIQWLQNVPDILVTFGCCMHDAGILRIDPDCQD